MVPDASVVQTADGPMPVAVCGEHVSPRAGIIIVHESFGVTEYITDVGRRVASVHPDWAIVAPHFFHRAGSPVFSYDQITPPEILGAVTAESLLSDIDGVLGYFARLRLAPENIGILGFCMGGNVAFYSAASRCLGAAVTFYGGGIAAGRFAGEPALLDVAAVMRTPWLGLYGDEDPSIPTEEVEELRAWLLRRTRAQQDAAPFKIVRYPDAGHGFHCDARPMAYHEWSAKDAWQRALNWMSDCLTAAG